MGCVSPITYVMIGAACVPCQMKCSREILLTRFVPRAKKFFQVAIRVLLTPLAAFQPEMGGMEKNSAPVGAEMNLGENL